MEVELRAVKQQLVTHVTSCLDDLCRVWLHIGYTQEEQQRNLHDAAALVRTLLSDLICNQTQVQEQLQRDVDQEIATVNQLCQQLGLRDFTPSSDVPLLELKRILVEKRHQYDQQLRERHMSQNQVLDRLASNSGNLGNIGSEVCESVQLIEMQSCSSATDLLAVENNPRDRDLLIRSQLERFTDIRNEVARLAKETGYEYDDKELRTATAPVQLDGISMDSNQNNTSNLNARSHPVLRTSSNPSLENTAKSQELDTSKFPSPKHTPSETEVTPRCDEDGDKLMLNDALMNEAIALRIKLVKHKASLAESIEESRSRVLSLWRRLEVDQAYADRFLSDLSVASVSKDTLRRLLAEEQRLAELKLLNTSVYVNTLLQEIRELQDACYLISEDNEKTQLDESCVEKSNEELCCFVQSLEKQVEQLSSYRERYKSIFDALTRFDVARRELSELEARMKTSEVLCNRTGLLMRLQKEEKSLQKELPKLESEILAAIGDAEKNDGVSIEVFGLPFRDYVQALHSEAAAQNQKLRASRRRTMFPTVTATAPADSEAPQPATSHRKASAHKK